MLVMLCYLGKEGQEQGLERIRIQLMLTAKRLPYPPIYKFYLLYL